MTRTTSKIEVRPRAWTGVFCNLPWHYSLREVSKIELRLGGGRGCCATSRGTRGLQASSRLTAA